MTEEPTVFGTISSNIPRLANNALDWPPSTAA
jgi:hypothetical protein